MHYYQKHSVMKKYGFLTLLLGIFLISCQKETPNNDEFLQGSDLKIEASDLDNTPCFEMIFPVSFIMPDRSIITGNSREELGAAIKAWHEAHPRAPKKQMLQYPVDVNFNGKVITVRDDQQMQRIKKACAGDKEVVRCIEIIFPITFLMPDQSLLTVEDAKSQEGAIKQWFVEHPDFLKQKPTLQYPVNIKFKGRELTIANAEQMMRVKKACAGDKITDRDKVPCFTLVFPLTYIMPDGTEITRNSQEDLDNAIKRWYTANTSDKKPTLKFPLAIKYVLSDARDGVKIVRIRTMEELKKAYAGCGK